MEIIGCEIPALMPLDHKYLESESTTTLSSKPLLRARNLTTRPVWKSFLAIVWVSLFATCFYQFDLPNSNPKINRMQIWDQLPLLLVNAVDPPPPAVGDLETRQLWKQAGWRNLPQRFGMYAVSLWILAGAWGWGHLLLRGIGLRHLLSTFERQFFGLGCGLSVVSLLMLGCGLVGAISRPILGTLITFGLLLEIVLATTRYNGIDEAKPIEPRRPFSWKATIEEYWPLLGMIPFVMCYIGGAFLPEIDFDVKEYHFGGPKEWFLAGKIYFLPHNVYTSFPFLTEMLTLLGMALYGDWYWGALAGKGVLMCFSLLTAFGLFVAGKRWFSNSVANWAVLIHLSTPWIYRISIIAYAEGGLTFYLFASLFAALLFFDRLQRSVQAQDEYALEPKHGVIPIARLAGLIGILAGSAMACKYPGVISVVLPLGIAIALGTLLSTRSTRLVVVTILAFSAGTLLTIGPWLLKNLVETGNPVYPLLYSIFGGTDWNAELNAKWTLGHSPDQHHLSDLGVKLVDVTLKADWLSPLLFGLAPLAFWGAWNRRRVAWLWCYVAYLFGTWWLFTHRIDRFWVPLIPIVSLLAAAGIQWNPAKWWRYAVGIAATLALTFNFAFITSSLCGYNAYLLDLKTAADHTARITAPESVLLNSRLPPGARVLCVGEAELFDARFSYVYNTVFDQSIFEQICGVNSTAVRSRERPFKSPAEIKQLLHDLGITHLLVNWQEILRYRTTYGYTDFVTPARFQQLIQLKVLDAAWETPGFQLLEQADPTVRAEIERWGPELIEDKVGQKIYKTFSVYPMSN